MPAENLAGLTKRLAAIVSKRPGVALWLWGEPGIGKTHTAQELLRQTSCHKLSIHATTASRALLELLPRPKQLPDWVTVTLEKIDRGASLEQIATALGAWLAGLAPFVVHVEDVHEAGPERLELLKFLAVIVKRSRGLALIATSRSPAPPGFEDVPLEPLGQASCTALLEAEVGTSLPEEASAWIYQHTGGNPLFSLEFFRHLARQGHLWSDGQRWRFVAPSAESIPVSVEAVIAQMLELAVDSDPVRAALETRAMLGVEVNQALWAQLSGLSSAAFQAAKHQLELHGILREARFVHPLFGEVARQMLAPQERCRIARRAIQQLEDSDPMRAAGFVQAAELPAPQAQGLLERAIQAALLEGNGRAVAHFRAAIAEYASPHERGRLLLEAAKVATTFSLAEGERLAALAVRAQPNDPEAVIWQARVLIALNRVDQARGLIEALPDTVFTPHQRWCVMIELKGLRDPEWIADTWAAHPELRAEASPAVRRQVGIALFDLGQAQAARSLFEALLNAPDLPALERIGTLNVLALIEQNESRFDRAEQRFETALELIEQPEAGLTPLQVKAWQGTIQANRCEILCLKAQLEPAKAALSLAMTAFAEVGNPVLYAIAQTRLAGLLRHQAAYKRAEELLLEAQPVLTFRPQEGAQLACQWATLYLDWTIPYAPQLALRHARDALLRTKELKFMETRVAALQVAGLAEAAHGQPGRALEYARELEDIAVEAQQPRAGSLAAWVRGVALERLGQPEAAIQSLREALASTSQSEFDVLERERIGLELDRQSADLASARQRVARAETHGWQNLVNLARRYFPRLEPDAQSALEQAQTGDAELLEVLGPMRFAGKPVSDRNKKAKECLALLLEARIAGRREVGQLELLDALYPELPEDKALGALRQLVFRLRAHLGQDSILRGSAGYSLGAIETDAERYLATHDPRLWRGMYLQDLGEGWDSRSREALYDALRESITAELETDPAEAARLGRLLLEANPLEIEALKLNLRVLAANADQRGLMQVYAQSRARFLEVGERLPEDWRRLLEA